MMKLWRKAAKHQPKKSEKRPKDGPKVHYSFRRNLVPPLIGLLVMVAAFGLLNEQRLYAEFKYRYHRPIHIIVQTASAQFKDSKPKAEYQSPTLIIPKTGIIAPIQFEPSTAEWKVQVALRNGVYHYATTSNPGENGNMVIFGHSSGVLWAPGNFKFVFTHLDKLQAGDPIIIDYQGTRYTYTVTSSEVIVPTNLSVLNQHTTTPSLSLITCTPVGTSKYRLVIHAEQVSPSPDKTAPGNANKTGGPLPSKLTQ